MRSLISVTALLCALLIPMAHASTGSGSASPWVEVLVYNARRTDAEALLTAVMQSDPQNARAHEAMGLLKYSEHDLEGARKWYGEAVQMHSDSYLAYFYDASLTLQANDTTRDDVVESDLRTVMAMNPNYADAYDRLAMFYGERDEKLDEAHMLNLKAVALAPGNLYYRINAASVLERMRRFDDAVNVLKIAKPLAEKPDEIAILQSRLEQAEQNKSAYERYQSAKHDEASQVESASTMTTVDGKTVAIAPKPLAEAPKYPAGEPTGARHVADGVIHEVQCFYPAVLSLKVEQKGKSVVLYSNNYYKTAYSATNFAPKGDLNPCKDIEGMKGHVVYAAVTDATVAGQIVSIELSK